MLPGHEREPSKVPRYKLSMGPGKKSKLFKSCPVGTTFLNDVVSMYMAAYNIYKAFPEWLPGRRDPRVLAAFVIIQGEHNKIDLERVRNPGKT